MKAVDLTGAEWRKATRSTNNGGNCVEVALNLVGADWRKSSRSGNNDGQCIEVAGNLPGIVGVRDSKDPAGPALVVSPSAWVAFTGAVKGGAFTA